MVIDTGIFIEFFRAKDKSKTTLYQLTLDAEIYVSAVTVYELHMGATEHEKHSHVKALLNNIPVLDFNRSIAERSSEIYHVLRKSKSNDRVQGYFYRSYCSYT